MSLNNLLCNFLYVYVCVRAYSFRHLTEHNDVVLATLFSNNRNLILHYLF